VRSALQESTPVRVPPIAKPPLPVITVGVGLVLTLLVLLVRILLLVPLHARGVRQVNSLTPMLVLLAHSVTLVNTNNTPLVKYPLRNVPPVAQVPTANAVLVHARNAQQAPIVLLEPASRPNAVGASSVLPDSATAWTARLAVPNQTQDRLRVAYAHLDTHRNLKVPTSAKNVTKVSMRAVTVLSLAALALLVSIAAKKRPRLVRLARLDPVVVQVLLDVVNALRAPTPMLDILTIATNAKQVNLVVLVPLLVLLVLLDTVALRVLEQPSPVKVVLSAKQVHPSVQLATRAPIKPSLLAITAIHVMQVNSLPLMGPRFAPLAMREISLTKAAISALHVKLATTVRMLMHVLRVNLEASPLER